MVEVEPLVDPKSLDYKNIINLKKLIPSAEIDFDEYADILRIYLLPGCNETVVLYLDENMGLLYDPDTLIVVGFHIEGFTNSFLKKNPNIANSWTNTIQTTPSKNLFQLRKKRVEIETPFFMEVSQASKRKIPVLV
jgi:hypothetical protein